jgi:zinc protease
MKLLRFIPLFSLVFIFGCAPKLGFDPKQVSSIQPTNYKPRSPQHFKLKNGIDVLLMEDHELPLVNVSLNIKQGFLSYMGSDPVLVGAMGSLMRQGGTKSYAPDELDLKLESLAARIESSFGAEIGGASFSCLSSDLDQIFPIFREVLLEPRFDIQRIHLWKEQQLEGIRRRKDDPTTVAGTALKEVLFGNTPFGVVSSSADIAKVDRLSLLRAHRKFVKPDGALLAVSGNVTREQIESLADKFLSDWPARSERLNPVTQVGTAESSGVYFIEMPFQQSSIAIARRGPARLTEDQYAISVFNEVFGSGGFSTRLMSKIRVELGYAYTTYGAIEPSYVTGRNIIFLRTKSESTGSALLESLKV